VKWQIGSPIAAQEVDVTLDELGVDERRAPPAVLVIFGAPGI
jgi:hypothetical protein